MERKEKEMRLKMKIKEKMNQKMKSLNNSKLIKHLGHS